jgi:glucokinase
VSTAAPVLAVDLGGTNMRAAVVDADGTILTRDQVSTPHERPCGEPLVKLCTAVRADHPIDHAVFALPGRVDYAAGMLVHAPNLPPGWAADLRADRFTGELGVPVLVANDADVAAVGEAYFGAGRGALDVVYVTVSTGVGAGIIVGGRVLLPKRSAGEVGHTVIDREAARAGKPNTVEDLGSGTALARVAADHGLTADGRELVQLVESGEPTARAVWDDAMFAVALGVVNVVQTVTPEVVVVGGGVGRNGELVLAPIRDALVRFGPEEAARPEIRTAELGDDPGLIGAAAWRRAMGGDT